MILGIFVVLRLFNKKEQVFEITNKEDLGIPKKEIPSKMNKGSLNSRQNDILKLMSKREILLPSDIYQLHPNVSTRTLRRDMTSLVELGLVHQEGSTRDTKYILQK